MRVTCGVTGPASKHAPAWASYMVTAASQGICLLYRDLLHGLQVAQTSTMEAFMHHSLFTSTPACQNSGATLAICQPRHMDVVLPKCSQAQFSKMRSSAAVQKEVKPKSKHLASTRHLKHIRKTSPMASTGGCWLPAEQY